MNEVVRHQALMMHTYHHTDLSLRILYLEGKQSRTHDEKRELLMYKVRKEEITLILERLN